LRVFALFKPSFRDIVAQLGRNKKASNEKAKKLPGWAPGSHEEAILASGRLHGHSPSTLKKDEN
jgi:hypothetical protein